MNRIASYLVAIVAATILSGCQVKDAIRRADAQIVEFHRKLDAGDIQSIWNSTGSDMRLATSRREFLGLLNAIHARLGNVTASQKVAWNSNRSGGAEFTTITNETVFERGKASEQFVFREQTADELVLVGYHIRSDQMVLDQGASSN